MIGGGGGPYTTSASPNVPALRYDPGGGISCRRMFMENLVMTTTLTIEELDASETTSAVVSSYACMGCAYCSGPEELDATEPPLATACMGFCYAGYVMRVE